MQVAIRRTTRFFAPRYEIRVVIRFSYVEEAIIEQHELYKHRIMSDLGQQIEVQDVYHRTFVKRFDTAALAKAFDERMQAAIHSLKSHHEFSARPDGATTLK
jgi:hypothetical protein